ncbi:hypothetical protein BDY21DRAFT_408618, partial [Lineolata rhizophorae]
MKTTGDAKALKLAPYTVVHTVSVRAVDNRGAFQSYVVEEDELYGLPLFSRAWCFQERLLARRVLHFTPTQMVFECRSCCQYEFEP